jgi:hypothetical protein
VHFQCDRFSGRGAFQKQPSLAKNP